MWCVRMKETLSYKLWNEEYKKMYREELMYSIGYNVNEEGFCIILDVRTLYVWDELILTRKMTDYKNIYKKANEFIKKVVQDSVKNKSYNYDKTSYQLKEIQDMTYMPYHYANIYKGYIKDYGV